MFDHISIIGCGLIGSSILRASNKKRLQKLVFDKSKEVTSYLKKENLSKDVSNNIIDAAKEADIIIIASPLSAYKEILLSLKDNLKKDAILTDVGSAKKRS